MMNAELCRGLAEGKSVRHQAEKASLGKVVEFDGSAAANGLGGDLSWIERVAVDFFARVLALVANNSGLAGGFDRDLLVGSNRHNQNALRGLRGIERLNGERLRARRGVD